MGGLPYIYRPYGSMNSTQNTIIFKLDFSRRLECASIFSISAFSWTGYCSQEVGKVGVVAWSMERGV
jgi:hypothetical protein